MTILLEGNISHISLFNLLQLIKLEQKTCVITINIKELQQEAKIYFNLGAIKHATLNKLVGEDALYRLLCWWNSGIFKIELIHQEDIPENSINLQLENILMSSAQKTDELSNLRAVVSTLDTKMSFSDQAIFEIQNELNIEAPDWIPGFVIELPITFSLAKFFEVCPLPETEACASLKYMISTGLIIPNASSMETSTNSSIESLASIIMEYLGFAQSQQLVLEACEHFQISPELNPGFSQLLSFCDYVSERLSDVVADEMLQEIEWRLRARVTSLS